MGRKKHLADVENLLKKSPVVNSSSIGRIVKNKQYAKQLLHYLTAKGRIHRIIRGYYSSSNDPSLAVFCLKPAYLGLQDALSFHNLWEQETIPVIITTAKVRQGIRQAAGTNVLVRQVNNRYLFGFEYYLYNNELYLPYSDIEKTFIDMVYFKQRINEETLKEIRKKVDKNKLNTYLKKYPKPIRMRALKIFLGIKNRSQYDEFLHKVQQKKMKELWDNKKA